MVRTSLNSRHLLLKSKDSEKRDRISNLPDDLLCRILSNLPTEDSVRTGVLSKRWKNLWLQVPALDLESDKFLNIAEFMDFFELFLKSNEDLVLNKFKLIYNVWQYFHDLAHWHYFQDLLTERIDDVIKRRVRHLTILNNNDSEDELVRMPLSLYSCATLVDLTLFGVAFEDPESEPVSLPCLKSMHLEGVMSDGHWGLEKLISNSLVLENLVIILHPDHFIDDVVFVQSKSLKSFKIASMCEEDCEDYDPYVEVNAPLLEYMSILNYKTFSIIIESIGPNAKVDIDVEFDNDRSETSMICDFFTGLSTVREMIISARTLKMIDDYRIQGQLPQFGNLACLDASFCSFLWEVLSYFLGFCPKLHALNLEFDSLPKAKVISTSLMPPCLASSLEYVKLSTPLQEMSKKKKLAIYFVRNCKVLKELALNGSFRNIIQSIRKIPKRSPICKIVMVN